MTSMQELAMQLILAGAKIGETAERLQVDRRTINRWMKHPEFQAGMAERKQVLRGALRGQLAAMLNQSFDAMETAMKQNDHRTAVGLLKAMHILDGEPLVETENAYRENIDESQCDIENRAAERGHTGYSGDISDETFHDLQQLHADREREEAANVIKEQEEADKELKPLEKLWAKKIKEHEDKQRMLHKLGETESLSELDQERAWEQDYEEQRKAQKHADLMGHLGHSAEISPCQQALIDKLESGKSLVDATHAIGLDVNVLRSWLRKDATFRSAIHADRLNMESYWELRSLMLGFRAADCIQQALHNGNGRVALALLKGLGVV
jgi:hypothetical protein